MPNQNTLNSAVKRIQREIAEDIEKNDELFKAGISYGTVNDNYLELKARMMGPAGTPYEGGNYILEIQIPSVYPFKPPKVRFATKIWHPNINSVTGAICLNTLDWVPCLGLRTVLLSIQALLSAAELNDPQDVIAANQYLENYETFQLTAKHWAQVYAGAPVSNPELEEKLENATRMLEGMNIDSEFEVKLETVTRMLQRMKIE